MDETVSTAELQAAIAEKDQQITQLKWELAELRRLVFGAKKERFEADASPEQLHLFEATPDTPAAEEESEQITYTRKKRKHPGRTTLPDHLPTEEILIEPEQDTAGMKVIGQQITETLDYRPGVLLKRRYIRNKYARVAMDESQSEEPVNPSSPIIMGSLPPRPLPKCIAESGLLAHLIVAKFVDHLPFYRQIQQFKRNHGWQISDSTLNDWFTACCLLLEPLYAAHLRRVMDTDYLQADESPIKVLGSVKKGQSHRGYMWVYRNPINGLVLFDYRRGRDQQGPAQQLSEFAGYLQCDGYKVYTSISEAYKDRIQLVSCLAHIRRKFYQARAHHPKLANQALTWIQQLYALERKYREKELSADQRQQERHKEARPIYEKLLRWVQAEQPRQLRKGPLGEALYYALRQLPKLTAYLEDGRIEIDNNLIENAIRPLALGRKNYLFAGSHAGAERVAMMYSFFASCKVHEVNPWEWLKDVLERIGDHSVNQLEELLPHQWKPRAADNPPAKAP